MPIVRGNALNDKLRNLTCLADSLMNHRAATISGDPHAHLGGTRAGENQRDPYGAQAQAHPPSAP